MKRSVANRGEILKDAAALLLETGADAEHALDEATAFGGLCTEAGVTPEHAMTQRALGSIVGGLDPRLAGEGPHRRFDLQEIGARGGGLRVSLLTAEQLEHHAATDVTEIGLERGPLQGAVSDAVPPSEQGIDLCEQILADAGSVSGALGERFERTPQMRPTQLTLGHRQGVIVRSCGSGGRQIQA